MLCHQVGPCVSAQAHFVECCTPRRKGGGSFYVMVRWIACLVCVADSYHFLNSELCAEHFYVSCLYVIYFPCVCCTCTVVPLVGLYR